MNAKQYCVLHTLNSIELRNSLLLRNCTKLSKIETNENVNLNKIKQFGVAIFMRM